MEKFTESYQKNFQILKKLLPAEDILSHAFETADKRPCALFYADGMVNKELLGDLAERPMKGFSAQGSESKNEGDTSAFNLLEAVKERLLFPEIKEAKTPQDACAELLDGNALLVVGGLSVVVVVGAKLLPVRAITEPPTDVAVKGPREGFIEDVKVNMTLVRKRLKTPELRMEVQRVGRRSQSNVCLCYLDGICDTKIKDEVKERIENIDVDCIPDSSYIAALVTERHHSVFRSVGTTERPDVFAAKLAEGRVGVLVDGSPIALTMPFTQIEDFQSNEDYYVSPCMATIFRLLRAIAVVVSLLLPAFYVCTQLFKMQLLPLGLTLTIAESTARLPLSPSMEVFLVLFVFEVLREASVRMPKYVGASLSIVGALVLGEAAVSAGFLSTPTIIVVAFSGICLYTVPNFTETGSILRWLYLIVAGSLGPFGLVLAVAFTLYYLITADNFSTPPLAPFSPLVKHDLKDALMKYDLRSLSTRPLTYHSPNRTRLKTSKKEKKQ